MPARPIDHWSQLSSLLDVLLDTPPDERAALLDRLSGGDAARRQELERLVAECERDSPLLNRPAGERFSALTADQPAFPEVLAERYRLTRELGRGGMATVFLAHDLKHARDVAVKVVHPALTPALGGDRFLREIRIVAQLHHPHIVPLFDSGTADGSLYYVMPYEPGASLRQRLAAEGRLPVDDAVFILRDVCDALAHAHQHGIVHRDIKPDNVLLSGRHAMVADFGVAKALAKGVETPSALAGGATSDVPTTRLTTAGLVLGTPAYMAPEQIAGDPHIDHRADIYSVGVLAYELLAGRPPFVGDGPHNILAAHVTAVPQPISLHRPEVPAPLAQLVMTCLAKEPADRWQSADELLRRLERLATSQPEPTRLPSPRARWTRRVSIAAVPAAVAAFAFAMWQRNSDPAASWRTRWANARVERLTDFAGSEVDAAISTDGRFVAFLADRDSVFDAFVTQVGSGQFLNLTGGRFPQLFNEDVRNVGFSLDGERVWVRLGQITSPAGVSTAPTGGGRFDSFLSTAVMAVWSPDGSKIAYHQPTPGDPIFIADRDGKNAQRIFVTEPGEHLHHLTWSPDGRFLYFSRGLPPNEMDIWRIPSTGGPAERITQLNSRVGYPVLLDQRTLLYSASPEDGTGPWLYTMDLERHVAQRLNVGVEQYISIAAGAEVRGQERRLVATVSNAAVHLWTVPITDSVAGEQAASRVTIPTARSAAPRIGPDGSVLYLASRGGADAVWRLSGDRATELWKAPDGSVAGAAAVSPDGRNVCVPVRRQARSTLYCMSIDGTGARAIGDSLDVRGAASWSPDGKWIAIAAREAAGIRVFKIPIDGGRPVRLVDSVSSHPVWSPDGTFIVYSGTSTARSAVVKAVTPDGRPYPLPQLSVDRIGDSYRFLPNGKQLVLRLGGFRRQDFWLLDVATGRQRPLTSLRPGEAIHRFDVSPDGKRIFFERVRENSDLALITLPAR